MGFRITCDRVPLFLWESNRLYCRGSITITKFIIPTNIPGKAASGWADRLNCIHWRYEECWAVTISNSCCSSEHMLTYLLTYLLTPWSRVLEKLIRFTAGQEIPRILRNPKFHSVFTSARHPSLSWANSIQSPPHPTSWRSILRILYHQYSKCLYLQYLY